MIHHGDLFDVLPTLPEASIDACVTDPPYGISFMGKSWDNFSPSATVTRVVENKQIESDNPNLKGRTRGPASSPSAVEYDRSINGQREFQAWTERWACEVYRVLKPGAYILVCGAPRSFHRMTCGLEDAGFVIRDCFSWLYGQGFPKSLNLGDGRGSALKPGWEPVILGRKPFKGTISGNVERHGTGALNIDACRIEHVLINGGNLADNPQLRGTKERSAPVSSPFGREGDVTDLTSQLGRWPANVLLDEEAAAMLDEMTGDLQSGFMAEGTPRRPDDGGRASYGAFNGTETTRPTYADRGGASRFYYVAKPSREERDYGTEGLIARKRDESRKEGNPGGDNPRNRGLQPRGNSHPTVKPVELMRWLVKLVTPIGGTVLDPFTGSGTTGMACRYEQRQFIGIEREAEYIAIAERRIAAVAPLFAEEAV